MKRYALLFIIITAAHLNLASQDRTRTDTVYNVPPVIVSATHAVPRNSPVTFSDLSRTQIQDRYSIKDIPALLSDMPSVIFYSENGNGIGYNYINLRGFDQRRLSIMVNGIPQNDPEDHNVYWIDFPDLLGSTENIQVQRGAGSAFYGPPAIGGSVNLLAVPFRPDPGVTIESNFGLQEYGSDNTITLSTQKYSAAFNSGLVDGRYMFYGRLGRMTSDGYRDKAWVDINSYFFGAARLDETMTTRIHLYGGPFSDGLVYNGIPKFFNNNLKLRRSNLNYFETNPAYDTVTYSSNRRPQETEQFSQPHFEIIHEWRVSPKITFYNTLFYIQGNGYYDYDGSWADTSMLRIGSQYGIPAIVNPSNTLIRAYVGNRQAGWLPHADLEHINGMLTLGAEIRIHRSTHWGKISYAENLPPNYDPDYRFYEYNGRKDILSLYVHEVLRPRNDLTLTADLQFAYNRYGISNEKYLNNSFSYSYNFINPRIGANYNIDDNINVYATIAYTSREPRLKNLYAAEESFYGATPQFQADTTGGVIKYNFNKPLARPERLFDFEIGAACRTDRNFIAFNFFWMEFTDELIKSGSVDIFGQPVTGNAGRTRHLGIELEGEVFIGNGFSISGNTSISQNRLVKYSVIDSAVNNVVYSRKLDGNPIAGSPDYTANVRLTQAQNEWSISANAKYVGSFYTDNSRNESLKNDSYLVLNLETLYKFSLGSNACLALRAEAHNLLNRLYTMNGEGIEFFPAAERNYIIGLKFQF